MKNFLSTCMLITCSILLFTYCDKDPEEGLELDPNKVTQALEIVAATERAGSPPAPTGAGAPDLSVDQTNLSVLEGGEFVLPFSVGGDFEGIYLQVKDADSYLDVPSTSAEGLRIKTSQVIQKNRVFSKELLRLGTGDTATEEGDFGLDVGVGAEISAPATFCILLCVYDSEDNVSNIVEVCVTVNSFGGDGELVGKWRYDSYESFEGGILVDSDSESSTYTDTIFCDTTGITVICNIEELSYIELKSNGDYTDNYEYVSVSCSPSDCPGYYEDGQYFGVWSYNSETEEFTLIDLGYNGEEYDEPDPYIVGKLVSVNSTTLVIREDYGPGEYDLIYFKRI